jgi:hypothetical protein
VDGTDEGSGRLPSWQTRLDANCRADAYERRPRPTLEDPGSGYPVRLRCMEAGVPRRCRCSEQHGTGGPHARSHFHGHLHQDQGWGTNPKVYSFSTGEEGRLGQHVPERYLDDRADLKGTRLKLLCRLGCLPTMHRVGREVKPSWPKATRTCLVCNTARIEDVAHFVLDCPAYACHRTRLLTDVTGALNRSPTATVSTARFQALPRVCRLALLLGQRFGDPIAENRIDRACKRYIKKAWNARADVTVAINSVLGTKYDVGNALPDSQDIS